MPVSITLDRVRKVHPNGVEAVREATLRLPAGKLTVLVGPSGSGKSTLLRLIAGLSDCSSGRVLFDDRDVTQTPPQERDIAMVFQSYALYPHMSVRENLAFGLRMRRAARREIEARIGVVASMLGLDGLLDRRPAELSGGQRQRVALGRALVREPAAFLLDEPLSNLDPALRVHARAEIARLHRQVGATMVYVTHDQEEAMTLGEQLVVMREGGIEQVAPPVDIYDRPANTFVARFLGSPPMNLLPAPMIGARGAMAGIRPHELALVRAGEGHLDGVVDVVEHRGQDALVHVTAGDQHLTAVVPRADTPPPGPVGLRVPTGRVHVFEANGTRIP